MKATERIWRTADGALVREGDLDAATLAYGCSDDIENRDEAEVKALLGSDAKPTTKKAPAPRNKKAPTPTDK